MFHIYVHSFLYLLCYTEEALTQYFMSIDAAGLREQLRAPTAMLRFFGISTGALQWHLESAPFAVRVWLGSGELVCMMHASLSQLPEVLCRWQAPLQV